MDIRTKLVFALVALALGSMLTLGFFMFESAGGRLNDLTERQLGAIAESSEAAIEELLDGWRERVQLIGSRTQLRLSLREYGRSGDAGELGRIERILTDALGSVQSLRSLGVYDAQRDLVAAVGEPLPARLRTDMAGRRGPGDGGSVPSAQARFVSAEVDESGRLRVTLDTDLVLDGEVLGVLLVVLTGSELLELTEDFPGLGETGEILLAIREDGGIRTLHRVRDAVTGELAVVELTSEDNPILQALASEEDTSPTGFVNYLGESVLAATRHIAETGWGVVVKFDDAEVQRSKSEFRTETITLALSLSAFAILFAVLLGMRFANPIHQLAGVANRIRGGEMKARANVNREDEIGMLARDFNAMANELEAQMSELHQYRMFFELSLDMLCIAGTDGYFKRVNPAFERNLGWSMEQLLEHPFLDLVHPDDVEATMKEIEKLSQGIPTISFVNRFRCADGHYRHLKWTSHPEPDGTLYASAREIADPSGLARIV